MGNTAYNTVKWIALIFLPAAGAAYFGLGSLWDFPEVDKVVGSVTVLETFLGLLLRKQAVDYGTAKTVGEAIVMHGPDGALKIRHVLDASAPTAVILQDKKVIQYEVKRQEVDENSHE